METPVGQQLTKLDETILADDSVDQMIVLAERIRATTGGDLDESAIQAVAEATGAPVEYVRLAVKLRTDKEKQSFLATIRSQFLTLEPHTRRFVTAGLIASGSALLYGLEERMRLNSADGTSYGVFAMLALALASLGVFNIAISRDSRQAAGSGAILAGGYYLMRSVFAFVLAINMHAEPVFFVPVTLMGALFGVAVSKIVERNRTKLGLKDPVEERQELLRQLHHLREKLHIGEQPLSFVSIDIVGSTRLKQNADPLAVEYSFNEYHRFVERITERYGGRVHSTAGDGVICAFESPQQAVSAAKNIQMEILELNTYGNKLGTPIVLRCGVHSGTVVAPDAGDVTSVSFADVIDIAAHLQKEAPPGGIAVSEVTAEQIAGGLESLGSSRLEVHNVKAAIWTPRSVKANPALTPHPPLPRQA